MIRGCAEKLDILYENLDWPMQAQFQKQVKAFPGAGVVNFDNVRLDSSGGRASFIRSAFIESFMTNSEIILASPGSGDPVHLANSSVTILNTNDGRLSEDLHNRSLPIHLAPRGSIHDQESPIGNPKLEFLPDNRYRIEAELRGILDRWRVAGMPLDKTVKHPMKPWAQTVGGILLVNGFKGFLQNQRRRRTADNPITEALAILGASCPNKPLRPGEWASLVLNEGLEKDLISSNDRGTERGRERGIGVVLSRHIGETFQVTTEMKTMLLRLDGGNRRWTPGENPHRRYIFRVIEEYNLQTDDEPTAQTVSG